MSRILCLIVACSAAVCSNLALAQCPHCNHSGTCYKPVVRYRCVQVPDVKPVKKVFYECKQVPYCLPSLPKFLHCDDCCTDCDCPRFKQVLVKREVEVGQICGTKCVIEEYVEHVPVPCCYCEPDQADSNCEVPAGPVRAARLPSRP